MSDHLRYAGLDPDAQRAALEQILRSQPVLMDVLQALRDMALPDAWLVSGAIYNTVWNVLTGRPALNGVKDIDVFYFDATDLSWDAEDRVIKALEHRFAGLPLPVEVRNQARVHLWYPQKFGGSFAPLTSSTEMLGRYASTTHAVAARLDENNRIHIEAPFGLNDIFSFRMVPNTVMNNQATHTTKGARAKAIWPELIVVPWPSERHDFHRLRRPG